MRSPKHKTDYSTSKLLIIGWREIIALPNLGISQIKAKIDTGGAFFCFTCFPSLQKFQRDGQEMIRFQVHPYQRDNKHTITTEAKLLEHREST